MVKKRKKRKLNNRGKVLIIIILLLALIAISVYILNNKNNKKSSNLEKKTPVKVNLNEVKNNYGHYVKTNKDTIIFTKDKKKVGTITKDVEIILDDNYNIKDEYYKLDGIDYYINYQNVTKIDTLSEVGYNEYKTYKNYIPYNTNVITKDTYKLYINDKVIYTINSKDTYKLIIKDTNKYGIEFNNRLVYISSDDVEKLIDNNNSNEEKANSLPVLNYHYTVNKAAGELNECVSTICMEDTQVEEEIKYLADNKYYPTTMRDVYLFLTGKINLPKHSVAITIDDGWYLARMITILEKYKMTGTLFLIGSLASPNDYKSEYLEIHSHSWNMHTPNVCNGTHGGAILCWEKEKILEDLKKSRESLNNTTVYCFPFYEYNDRVIGYLKEAGFEMAFIGGDKKAKVGDDIFKIPRFELVNYTTKEKFIEYVS